MEQPEDPIALAGRNMTIAGPGPSRIFVLAVGKRRGKEDDLGV